MALHERQDERHERQGIFVTAREHAHAPFAQRDGDEANISRQRNAFFGVVRGARVREQTSRHRVHRLKFLRLAAASSLM